jgi:hypothetical protein
LFDLPAIASRSGEAGGYSIFSIRYSLFYPRMRRRKAEVSFSIKLAISAASGGPEPVFN